MMFIALALVAAVVTGAHPKWHELSLDYTYSRYLHDFHKSYACPREHARRQALFERELKSVMAFNGQKPRPSYRRGINHMSDWTEEEKQGIRGGRYDPSIPRRREKAYAPRRDTAVPSALDYRNSVPAVLTAVKDQGFCGDCWAHAVTEAVESSYAIATGELYVLSQQQVTSCTPPAGGCYSCNGSFPSLGFEYVADAGLTEEWVYPFESYNASFPACRKNPTSNPKYPLKTAVNISGYFSVTANRQVDTMQALQEMGPLSILVDASTWSSYESGVFNGCSYAKNISLDHAVLLVGYGSENGNDYWIVRNSWSPAWGEAGYIRLAKPEAPACGWDVGAAHRNGCYGVGPAQVWACGECGLLLNPQFPIVLN